MKGKKKISYFWCICALSVCCLLLLPVAASLTSGGFAGPDSLSAGLLCAGAVLLLLPVSEESAAGSLRFALVATVVGAAAAAAGLPARVGALLVMAVQAGYLSRRSRERYAQLWPLFKPFGVWRTAEVEARACWSMVLYLLAAAFPGGGAPLVARWACAACGLVLYTLLWVRAGTGRTLYLGWRKEQEIKELIKGSLRVGPTLPVTPVEDSGRMRKLYERVVDVMEKKHPFLDEEFTLDDLARIVFSNRAYLSKTINILSGRNFSQFVNGYRVRYSMDLLRRDPSLRLIDVAMMSGFHTTVTFNMAFKLNMGETPSQFQERVRLERLSH